MNKETSRAAARNLPAPLWLRFVLLSLLLPSIVTCTGGPAEGSAAGDCNDEADNDSDGLFDCDDPDCSSSPECAAQGDDDDDDSSSTGCAAGEVLDCNGHCAPSKWLGDGQCDNGAYPYYGNLIDFACAEFEFDNGDCSESGDDDDSAGSGDDDDSAVEAWSFSDIYAFVLVNCSCHSEPNHPSGFHFSSGEGSLYDAWLGSTGTGAPSSQLPSMNRIEPFSSSQSYVWHKLDGTHINVGGSGSRMPQGGPFLSEASLEGIRAWIDQGAQADQ